MMLKLVRRATISVSSTDRWRRKRSFARSPFTADRQVDINDPFPYFGPLAELTARAGDFPTAHLSPSLP